MEGRAVKRAAQSNFGTRCRFLKFFRSRESRVDDISRARPQNGNSKRTKAIRAELFRAAQAQIAQELKEPEGAVGLRPTYVANVATTIVVRSEWRDNLWFTPGWKKSGSSTVSHQEKISYARQGASRYGFTGLRVLARVASALTEISLCLIPCRVCNSGVI
jgi:hypothetical protein